MTDQNNTGVSEENVQPSAENPTAEAEGNQQVQETAPEESQAQDNQNQETGDAHLNDESSGSTDKDTQAFIAMRKKIKDQEERLRAYEDDLDLVNMARGVPQDNDEGQYQPQTQVTDDRFDDSDPTTKAFMDEVRAAKEEAQRARREALQAKAAQEDSEAWQKYPNLNPKAESFDKGFQQDVQKEYIAAKILAQYKGKKPPRLLEVADAVQSRYEQIRQTGREQGAQETKATLAQKEAATIESRGTSIGTQNVEPDRIEALRDQARRGDINAITELNKLTDPFLTQWN